MLGILKRLRGALGTALTWGVGWFGATAVTFGGLLLAGVLSPEFTWGTVVETALNLGITGIVAGGAFSAVIRLRYHGRQLLDISLARFGVTGGVLAGLFVPAFIILGRLVTGAGALPIETLLLSGAWATVFGGLTAAGSLKLAQRASLELPPVRSKSLESLEHTGLPASMGGRDAR
jgi:hypothetical protein